MSSQHTSRRERYPHSSRWGPPTSSSGSSTSGSSSISYGGKAGSVHRGSAVHTTGGGGGLGRVGDGARAFFSACQSRSEGLGTSESETMSSSGGLGSGGVEPHHHLPSRSASTSSSTDNGHHGASNGRPASARSWGDPAVHHHSEVSLVRSSCHARRPADHDVVSDPASRRPRTAGRPSVRDPRPPCESARRGLDANHTTDDADDSESRRVVPSSPDGDATSTRTDSPFRTGPTFRVRSRRGGDGAGNDPLRDDDEDPAWATTVPGGADVPREFPRFLPDPVAVPTSDPAGDAPSVRPRSNLADDVGLATFPSTPPSIRAGGGAVPSRPPSKDSSSSSSSVHPRQASKSPFSSDPRNGGDVGRRERPGAVSPPPAVPSSYAVAVCRLAEAVSQMEYAYARHLVLTRRHERVAETTRLLESSPVGEASYRDELEALKRSSPKTAVELLGVVRPGGGDHHHREHKRGSRSAGVRTDRHHHHHHHHHDKHHHHERKRQRASSAAVGATSSSGGGGRSGRHSFG